MGKCISPYCGETCNEEGCHKRHFTSSPSRLEKYDSPIDGVHASSIFIASMRRYGDESY